MEQLGVMVHFVCVCVWQVLCRLSTGQVDHEIKYLMQRAKSLRRSISWGLGVEA